MSNNDLNNQPVGAVTNLIWNSADKTSFNCEVTFSDGPLKGIPVPFTATSGDTTEHGKVIWQAGVNGDYGRIRAYTPPTTAQLRANLPALEKWRVDTVIDLEPGLRDKINAAVEAMSEPNRTISKNKLASVTLFYRNDPLFDLIGSDPSIGKSPIDIDQMWSAALQLA